MKHYQFMIFLTVVLTIYSLANLYIFLKGFHVLTSTKESKILYTVVFLFLATTFIAGKILESRHSSVFSDILNIAGGIWMGFMLYAFLFLLLSDITALFLRVTGTLNSQNIFIYRKWAFLVTLILSGILIAGGSINALIPAIKKYEISIDKPAGDIKSLRVAAVSDIHLGSTIRKRSMIKLSRLISDIKPDIIFLLGDIVDGELGPVLRGDLLKSLTIPETKYGLFAITGNHEYIGGAKKTIPYIEGNGIRILKDEKVTLPGGIQIIGRLDRDAIRFNSTNRLSLEKLMEQTDTLNPVILLDHQPLNLAMSEKTGVDLQLSGHTHNGQIWPLNYITRKIFELSYGYIKKGETHYIVSSGFGLWGPPIRSGSRSEVVQIDIRFRENGSSVN